MGQSQQRENPPTETKPINHQNHEIIIEETNKYSDWAERILLVGLRRSGKTLFLQTLQPTAILDKDLFESVSGKVLTHILKALIYTNGLDLSIELFKMIKSSDGGERISSNLNTFMEIYIQNSTFPISHPISFTELLLDLWNFRFFVDFYNENMDRFNFNENVELFVERLRQFRMDGIVFDPFRIISRESYDYTQVVKELDGNFISIIENGGTRPDTKLNAKKVIVMTVSLPDCMITTKDESNLINLSNYTTTTTLTDISLGKFDSAISFFEDISKSRALKDFKNNTRLCILFTKADLLMKRLTKFEIFPRDGKEECKIQRNELLTLKNTFLERHVINYVVNEFHQVLLNAGMESVEFDYHIINALNEEEVNGAFNLIVKPFNERGILKHYISPSLYKPLEYIFKQLWKYQNEGSFSDIIILS